MNPRDIVKELVLKRLMEALPQERVQKNLPALKNTTDKIMKDLDSVISLLVSINGKAPKETKIKGLSNG